MTESILSNSVAARNRRWILWADLVSAILLIGTGALFLASRQTATGSLLSTLTSLVSQACAVGAAVLLVAGLWRRPSTGASFLSPILDERETPERLAAQRLTQALDWKLVVLRTAIGIIILQATLMGISAVLP
ncbi:hypothetical protein [Nonomuraea sp. NEAU-A123]|uniref:hypothetical protein n=1 Tax=Nonomuraea sp. NEAU-A123 TaxID=2839649 RepID=UPI001BE4877A|nr:hypothetical protein [Nonomuraea sp. NEAU-A123]MBT2231965.1 hypothetical protein [Nonomuraea sp. NEAU-A123]